MDGGHGGGHGGGDGGSNGSGRARPPAAKLVRCDSQFIILKRNDHGANLIGLMFIIIGLFYGICMYYANLEKTHSAWDLVPSAFGLVFAAIGCVILKQVSVHIDIAKQTYKIITGWPPIARTKQGSCEEFSQLSLGPYGAHGIDSSLSLHWHRAPEQTVVLHTSSGPEAQLYGIKISSQLNLLFVDEKNRPITDSLITTYSDEKLTTSLNTVDSSIECK